jgi:hypothetical protein
MMPRNMTSDELAGIAQRAELFFRFGDTEALREEDLADLIREIRELHQLRTRLIGLHRQCLDRLRVLDQGVATEEMDPPWSELEPP